jgi:hypothetical protein
MGRARILVYACDYKPRGDAHDVWSPVRFTVSYEDGSDFSAVATVRQVGVRPSFRELQVIVPIDIPTAVDRFAIWTSIHAYFGDAVRHAALTHEDGVSSPCEVRDQVAYDFDVLPGAWRRVGTAKGEESETSG